MRRISTPSPCRFLAVSLVVVFLSADSFAAVNWTSVNVRAKEAGQTYTMINIPLAAGEGTLYNNGEDCGNTAHRTAKGSRYFAHSHFSYALPKDGTDNLGNPRQLTAAKIDAYWDDHYQGYTKSGSVDLTINCWGYSFGYTGAYIQDPSYVYSDDYESTDSYKDATKWTQTGHIVNIDAVWPNSCDDDGMIRDTSEKNEHGAIYSKSYIQPGQSATGKKKPKP